jgi:gliding motility-associated-like protein
VLEGGSVIDTALQDQSNLRAGTYSVEVYDNQGCSVRDTFELIQPTQIQITVDTSSSVSGTTNLNCSGDKNGTINVEASGGEGPYSYAWENGSSGEEQDSLSAGSYTITVTDVMNCSVTDTIEITEPPPLKIDSADISDYNGKEIACAGDSSGTISIYASGGTGEYSYTWKRNGISLAFDTSRIDGLRAGGYSLIITDENFCSIDTTLSMESPGALTLVIDTTSVDCTGEIKGTAIATVTGGILPYEYYWSTEDTTRAVEYLDMGDYWIIVTDSNGCTIADTFVIDQDPTVEFELAVAQEISCFLGSDGILVVTVTSGIPPYSYLWNNGQTDSSITGISEGEYDVTVTDYKGCNNNESIVVNDPEKITPILTIFEPLCFGTADGIAELDATGGSGDYTYRWGGNPVDGTRVTGLAAGSYTVTAIDSNNCVVDTSITIDQPGKMILSIDETNTVLPFCPDWRNGTLVVFAAGGTPPYLYSWPDYPEISDSVLPDVKEGYYSVSVTDQQNCFSDTTLKLESQNNSCLNIPTAFTPNNDGANDFWDISYTNELGEAPFYTIYPNGTIKIFDRWGTLVFMCESGCHDMWWGQDLKGRDLPSDSYHYIIELNDGSNRMEKGAVTIIK